MTKLVQLACAAVLAASSIHAEDTVLQIDPSQTKVEFTLADVLHTVHGTFLLKRGDMRFDAATGKASGELVVDATSGASGSGARDRNMHKNVLESARYPEIVFRPDRVEGKVTLQGTSHVGLHGIFSIHGAEHEITLPAVVENDDGKYAADIAFAVPYVQWGMKNPSTLFLRVSDKVEIGIHTVARAAK
ncbi:MAG TPA: YceI family protein [Bryobacteraceae bacterium]|nr:YceI family protein [Bryobacteraceae bacterium]